MLVAVVMILVMVVGVSGCGGDLGDGNDVDDAGVSWRVFYTRHNNFFMRLSLTVEPAENINCFTLLNYYA